MRSIVSRFPLDILLVAIVLAIFPLRGQAQGIDDLLDRARVAQSSGNYAEAATLYARATALSPVSAELWANRGVMEYLAGQMDASVSSLKRSVRLNPNLLTPLLFLGKAYVQTGKPLMALPHLNHAHTLQPSDPEVVLTLAKANSDLNRPRTAASFYANAVQLAPQNTSGWLGLGVASLEVIAADGREMAVSQKDSIWARALFADELLTQGRPLEATDIYKTVFGEASPPQRTTLTRNLEWLRSHPDLVPLPSNSQEALQQLAQQMRGGELQPGPLKDAQDDSALPQCASPRIESAACAYWAGDYEKSATQAGQTLRLSPTTAEALYWSIKANERIAVAALSRFEEFAPHSAASYDMVGDLYQHQRENDNALAEYKKALATDAHDPGALMGAVLANLGIGQLDEAESMDKAALADRPLDPQLNLLMAEILASENQLDKMKPYLQNCAAAPPELQPRVHLLLGRAAAQHGETEAAIQQFEMALPGDQDGSIHYQLSRLYRKAGKVAQAEKAELGAKTLISQRLAKASTVVREASAQAQ